MTILAYKKEKLFQTWICLYIKQAYLRPLTQQRRSYFGKSVTDVWISGVYRKGRWQNFCGMHHLVWLVQWHSGLPGVASEQESVWQGCSTQQLPAEQIQSTAVWLRKQQIGRTLQPTAEVSWDICYSCKSVYIKYVIQGLKLKLKWTHNFWNSLQTFQHFV